MVRPSSSLPMGTGAHFCPAEALSQVRFNHKRICGNGGISGHDARRQKNVSGAACTGAPLNRER
jgi:hypothetical protein